MKIRARVEVKPQDCWIGAFWRGYTEIALNTLRYRVTDLWICVIPMIPLHLTIRRPVRAVRLDPAARHW